MTLLLGSVSSQSIFFDLTDLESVIRNRLDLGHFLTWYFTLVVTWLKLNEIILNYFKIYYGCKIFGPIWPKMGFQVILSRLGKIDLT